LYPKIAKNSLKLFWEAKGRSRSSLLINLKSLSPVLVMISSMSVPNYLSTTVFTIYESISAK